MDFWSQVWKRVWEMAFFGLKLGLDLEMRAAHPHKKFQGVAAETRPPMDNSRDASDKERSSKIFSTFLQHGSHSFIDKPSPNLI